MFMIDMCPHHAPCGLCVKYDKPCNEVCGKDKNNKENKLASTKNECQNEKTKI